MSVVKISMMKNIKRVVVKFVLGILPAFGCADVIAQNMFAQYVTIDKTTVLAENLSITDSLDAESKMIHTAVFDITVSNAKNVQQFLLLLDAGMSDKKEMDITFSKYNTATGKFTEERFYYSATVKQIMIPVLNASLKSALKLRVFVAGIKTNVAYNPKSVVQVPKPEKVTNAMAGNFKLTLANLPTRRVRSINGINVTAGTQAAFSSSVELSATDDAAWNSFYNNGAGQTIPEGTIELLSPNLRDVVLTLYLKNIRLNSYRANSSGGNTIAMVIYGLSVGEVRFSK